MSEAQLSMLSNIFPRHIVEFLSFVTADAVPEQIASIAKAHDQVDK